MNETPNYYAVIPANVRYCQELSANEKLLYGEITALCNKTGECWATNKYFGDLYGVDDRTVRRWIHNLAGLGFIDVVMSNNSERHITILTGKNALPLGQKCPPPQDKNVLPPQDKNVRHNNTSMNNTRENSKETVFRITHTEGIRNTTYCKEVAPTGDVLGDKRPVGANDLPRPKKKTVPEDYGLVKFPLESIQIGDWERLLNWFEYNHREHATGNCLRPYCQKMFKQYVGMLKTLSGGNWFKAVDCVEGAINKGYQGFGDTEKGFYFKPRSDEDYELEMSLAKDFITHPEDLPERVMRYKPLLLDETIKFRQKWADDFGERIEKYKKEYAETQSAFALQQIEKLTTSRQQMLDGIKWCIDQKKTLQSQKS